MFKNDRITYELMAALDNNDTLKIKSLIESDPDAIHLVMPYHPYAGMPLLSAAIQNQNTELVQFLLDRMTPQDLSNILHSPLNSIKVPPEVDSPLMQAIVSGNIDIIQLIINKDPSALNKRHQYNGKSATTPLITAILLGNANLISILLNNGADVNFPHASGGTPLGAAIQEQNPLLTYYLKSKGATPDISQNILIKQFATWLELKASSPDSATPDGDVRYDRELALGLANTIRSNGHCAGFAWMHRIMMNHNQDDLFKSYMEMIADWDKSADSLANEPLLDRIFNQLLQVTIYAQQSSSLNYINDTYSWLDTLPKFNQSSSEIPRMISPHTTGDYFNHYVHVDHTEQLQVFSAGKLKDFIDESFDNNTSILAGSDSHVVDIGKIFKDGQETYWIYDSNFSCGTMYFSSFDEFFLSLKYALTSTKKAKTKESFNAAITAPTLPIILNTYMRPLEYRYEVMHENQIRTDQSIEDFLQSKMSNDFYTLIELDTNEIDGLYIEFKNSVFHFNNNQYKNLSELSQAITAFCGENVNAKVIGAYDIRKVPPALSPETMVKMFSGAMAVNDFELAKRLQPLILAQNNVNLLAPLAEAAATIGDIESLKMLLALKPELAHLTPKDSPYRGESLISLAVRSGSVSCVDEILKYEPELIHFVYRDGPYKDYNLLAATIAQRTSSDEMIEYLVSKNPHLANVYVNQGIDILTPLMLAIMDNSVDRARILIKHYPECVNAVINTGYDASLSPLILAIQQENPEMISLLVKHNANVEHRYRGTRAFDFAPQYQHLMGARPTAIVHQPLKARKPTSSSHEPKQKRKLEMITPDTKKQVTLKSDESTTNPKKAKKQKGIKKLISIIKPSKSRKSKKF